MLATTLELIARMHNIKAFLAAVPKLTEGLDAVQRRLEDALALLVSLSATQAKLSQAASAAPRQLNELRGQLRADHMRPIVEIAKQHHLPSSSMPSASDRTSNLVNAAHAMSNAAERFVETYIALGLPTDFVHQLRTAADDITRFIEKRDRQNAARIATTFDLLEAAAGGRLMMKIVDARMGPRIRNDAALLDAWEAVVRSRANRKLASMG